MPVSHKDHRGVAVVPAVLFGRVHQALDLGLDEMLAGPQVAIGTPLGGDCSIYGGRPHQLEVRFAMIFSLSALMTVRTKALLETVSGLSRDALRRKDSSLSVRCASKGADSLSLVDERLVANATGLYFASAVQKHPQPGFQKSRLKAA